MEKNKEELTDEELLAQIALATARWAAEESHRVKHEVFMARWGAAESLLSAVAPPASKHWLGFTEQEQAEIREWKEAHVESCPAVQEWKARAEPGPHPAGCFGDSWSYVVHPMSVGTMYHVVCELCSAKLEDVTDLADCW